MAVIGLRRRIRFVDRFDLDPVWRFRRFAICEPVAWCGFISSELFDLHCIAGLQVWTNGRSLGLVAYTSTNLQSCTFYFG